jgi:transcription elongation GreA/GreB family factor
LYQEVLICGDRDMNEVDLSVLSGPAIAVGSRVVVRGKTDKPVELIVAATSAESGLHALPPQSPLARALLGHRAGDEVEVGTNAGTVKFTVMEVHL